MLSCNHTLTQRLVIQILREQPENIYEYGAKYFANLVESRNVAAGAPAQDAADKGPAVGDLSVSELEEFILRTLGLGKICSLKDASQTSFLISPDMACSVPH